MEKFILGVVASKEVNLNTQREDYALKIEITKDVLDWLNMHDIRLDEVGNTIYKCNAIEYIYLGPKPKGKVILMGKEGKA